MSSSASLLSIKWHPASGTADPALRDHRSTTVINAVCFVEILGFYPVKQEFLSACIFLKKAFPGILSGPRRSRMYTRDLPVFFFLASRLILSLVCFVEHLDSILDQANTFKLDKLRICEKVDGNRSQRYLFHCLGAHHK